MSLSDKDVPQKLKDELYKLRTTYDYKEIEIGRVGDMVFVEYITSFKNKQMKLHFAFKMDSIQSTIVISIKKISSKKTHGINSMAQTFMTAMLKDKFLEQIDNMPIYESIECWDHEFALKTASSSSKTSSSKSPQTSLSPKPLNSAQKRKITKVKEEVKEKLNLKHRVKKDKEYVAFLRFNQLFQGTQQKKDSQILEELYKLKTSNSLFASLLYGTPGIICIRSTSKIIKKFVKKCTNDIGKKPVIAYTIDMQCGYHNVSRTTIQEIKDDKHHNRLLYLLETFKFKDKVKILKIVLTKNAAKNNKKKQSKSSISKGIYAENTKYEFNVTISLRWSYSYSQGKNGTLYISLFGQNENKLISNHRFAIKRWRSPTLKFEFSSTDFLNKIGNLTKIYFENHGKESWQIDMVTIDVYETNIKNKKTKGPSLLAKQYKKELDGAFVRNNSSLSVNLA